MRWVTDSWAATPSSASGLCIALRWEVHYARRTSVSPHYPSWLATDCYSRALEEASWWHSLHIARRNMIEVARGSLNVAVRFCDWTALSSPRANDIEGTIILRDRSCRRLSAILMSRLCYYLLRHLIVSLISSRAERFEIYHILFKRTYL